LFLSIELRSGLATSCDILLVPLATLEALLDWRSFHYAFVAPLQLLLFDVLLSAPLYFRRAALGTAFLFSRCSSTMSFLGLY
jgi:hypothetical protein